MAEVYRVVCGKAPVHMLKTDLLPFYRVPVFLAGVY